MIIIGLIVLAVVSIIAGIYESVIIRKKVDEDFKNNEKSLAQFTNTYGEPTITVFAPCYSVPNTYYSTDINSHVMVFEPTKKIFLKGKMYDFSQITGYSISVNNQVISSNTKTSTGSMLGRAAVGGALLGGVGAIIGANSAKTETEYKTLDKTIITIFTNSLSEPSIVLDLISPQKEDVGKIEGILRIITNAEA